jgi:hypothetical protein
MLIFPPMRGAAGYTIFLHFAATPTLVFARIRSLLHRDSQEEDRCRPNGWPREHCVMREDQIDQLERRSTLENDQRVREQAQGTTMSAFAQAESKIPGRFEAIAAAHVVGSTPDPAQAYPAASAPFQADPVGTEPPLGFRIDEMPIEPSALIPVGIEATGAPADAAPPSRVPPSLADGELGDAGASLSQSEIGGEPAPEERFPASGSTATVGSSPSQDGGASDA